MRSRPVGILAVGAMAMVVAIWAATELIQSADDGPSSASTPQETELVDYLENKDCRAAALDWLREMRLLAAAIEATETPVDPSVLDEPAYVVKLECSTKVRHAMTAAWASFIGAQVRLRSCGENPAECDPAVVSDRLSTVREYADRMAELMDRVDMGDHESLTEPRSRTALIKVEQG